MNETGLTESMLPKQESKLYSLPSTEKNPFRALLPSIPLNNENQIPHVYEVVISDIDIQNESIQIPATESQISGKPLFVFALQSNLPKQTVQSILDTLDEWNTEADCSFVILGNFLTVVDLKTRKSFAFCEQLPTSIPIFPGSCTNFSTSIDLFNEIEPVSIDYSLFQLLSTLPQRPICLCLFLAPAPMISTETQLLFSKQNVTRILFALPSYNLIQISRYCHVIHRSDTLGRDLRLFLRKNHFFEISFKITPDQVKQIYYGRIQTDKNTVNIPYMNTDSSIIIELYPPVHNSHRLIEVSLQFTDLTGKKSTILLKKESEYTDELCSLSSDIFIAWYARVAVLPHFFDPLTMAYKRARNVFVEFVRRWSSKGYFHRQIDPLLSDIPILVWGLLTSDAFERDYNTRMAMTVNLLMERSELVLREVHPQLIVPPLRFGHRLTSSTLEGLEFGVFVQGFRGVAFWRDESDHNEEIMKIEEEKQIVIDVAASQSDIERLLVEDRKGGFIPFLRKMEAEVNGTLF